MNKVEVYVPSLDGLSYHLLFKIIRFVDIDTIKTLKSLSLLNKGLYKTL